MVLENIVEICIAIDIAILGIAYPIIVDKITNIGDKYGSNYLSEVFNNERPQKSFRIKIFKWWFKISIFRFVLFGTVITFLPQIFKVSSLTFLDCWLVNNSANLIVFFGSASLTITFVLWLDKVALYNGKPTSLLKHLINKHQSNRDNIYILKTINEFAHYALDKQDIHLQETLLTFYSVEFAKIRRDWDSVDELVYPIDLYELVSSLCFELSIKENKKLLAIEHRAVSGIWLLGENLNHIKISEQTYSWLWRNLYNICDNPKFVKMHIQTAHQYRDFQLQSLHEELDYVDGKVITTNQEQVNSRKQEIIAFSEHYIALGGLLLFKEQYTTLNYLLTYTQSVPPRYLLFPRGMAEVFRWFNEICNEYKSRDLEYKYSFPGIDSMLDRSEIRNWICCYLAVVYIRQFYLHEFYSFEKFTNPPMLPGDILELYDWSKNILFFERCLKSVVSNKSLLTSLDLKEIVIEKEGEMTKLVDDLKLDITAAIECAKTNASLSAAKIEKFEHSTTLAISSVTNAFSQIFEKTDLDETKEYNTVIINGGQSFFPKSAFTDNDITHLNFDSVFANHLSQQLRKKFLKTLVDARTSEYLLNEDNVCEGIEALSKSNKDVTIITIGLSFRVRQILASRSQKINELEGSHSSMSDILLILPTKDLPKIRYAPLPPYTIEERQLKLVDENLNLLYLCG